MTVVPELSALPSPRARAVAFAGICLGGMLGAVAGYGLADLQCDDGSCFWPLVLGAMAAAFIAASGASVLAVIALRALPGWRTVILEAEQETELPRLGPQADPPSPAP